MFVSRVEFIRSKLSIVSAHVSGVDGVTVSSDPDSDAASAALN